MKARITLIAAAFTLQAGILLADNDVTLTPVPNAYATISITTLNPTTPVEATFEEESVFDVNQLMPAIPTEATFEDAPIDMVSILNLTPLPPTVADFDDDVVSGNVDNGALAPVVPATADFE